MSVRRFAWTLALAAIASVPALAPVAPVRAADDADATYLDPAKAPESYALQGEFTGWMQKPGSDEKMDIGGQVIALGNDKFEAVGYPGGLPGAGWAKKIEPHRIAGQKEGDKLVFVEKKDDVEARAEVVGDTMTLFYNGEKRGELKRVTRESPTLGEKAPEGAIVLFDGTSADKWENGKMTEEKFLAADTSTKQKFKDYKLHIEFRTPFKPAARGQARGNSGVYASSRYEIQVLDSFGLKGEDNECGGIYSIAKPDVNMCFPPLTWQTYDIDFTMAKYDEAGKKTAPARITVKHNGVVIHDDIELPHGTPGKLPEGPEPAPIYLQGHGNPVVYKNIWIQEK